MRDRDIVVANLNVGDGVGPAFFVQEKRITLDATRAVVRMRCDLEEASIHTTPTILTDTLTDDGTARVWSHVEDLGSRVLPLIFVRERECHVITPSTFAHEDTARVEHRDATSHIATDPLHEAVLLHDRALGIQVVRIATPVLDRRVPALGTRLHEDFYKACMEAL